MAWADRPTDWDKPGHTPRGWENERILDQIETLSNLGFYGISAASSSDTETGSSFADIAGFTFTFTKYADWTSLSLRVGMSLFSTSASTEVEIAVRINGTDYTVCDGFFFNEANSHRSIACEEKVGLAVIPAGVYTVQVRWRRVSGAGTLTVGSGDDYLTSFVEEKVT